MYIYIYQGRQGGERQSLKKDQRILPSMLITLLTHIGCIHDRHWPSARVCTI